MNNSGGQFEYLGKWVNKNHFRAFVYNQNHEEKLADSYDEFEALISSGIWFATKELASEASKERKQKNGTVRTTS